jgi:hypothetical protein
MGRSHCYPVGKQRFLAGMLNSNQSNRKYE